MVLSNKERNNGALDYSGRFINGRKYGYGKMYKYNSDGISSLALEGDFKDDHIQGKGILYYDSGNIMYNGNLIDSEPDGYGIFYEDNNEHTINYQGQFKDSVPNGKGIYYEMVIQYIVSFQTESLLKY